MSSLGVIFDMDGVLVDSNTVHFETFQMMAQMLGTTFSAELWSRTIGMHNNAIFPLWLGEGLSPEKVAELAAQKEAMYREHAAKVLKPVTGAKALVEALHADGGFKLAVGSSGPRENVALAIKLLNIAHCFDAVVTGHDVSRGKPDPEIFLKAGAQIGVEASKCLVIEDAPQGIRAALAAKMRVVGLTTSKTADELGAATMVVDSLTELGPDRVRKILGA